MTTPYYSDEFVTLYHGDHRDVLPSLGLTFDLIVADPPYGETSLEWDRWPTGWPALLTSYARSMWCFGSMRMFMDRRDEFASWKLSQDVVWEKHNGSGFLNDRFRRVHEHALHWYTGGWAGVHHEAQTRPSDRKRQERRKQRPPHTGERSSWAGGTAYVVEDGGPVLMTSVIFARSMQNRALNETEKPVGVVEPLIAYACPPGGLVLDPFAGSCSTAAAARAIGRRAVCIETREPQCEAAAKRLAQGVLDFGASA